MWDVEYKNAGNRPRSAEPARAIFCNTLSFTWQGYPAGRMTLKAAISARLYNRVEACRIGAFLMSVSANIDIEFHARHLAYFIEYKEIPPDALHPSKGMTSAEDEDRAVKLADRAVELVAAGQTEVSGQQKKMPRSLNNMAGWLQSVA